MSLEFIILVLSPVGKGLLRVSATESVSYADAQHHSIFPRATRGCTMRVRLQSFRLVFMPVSNPLMRHW
jgi:hypothetical protein